MEFVDSIRMKGYDRIPTDDAIEKFKLITGIMNRGSLRDYFGSQASRSTRKIDQFTRYTSGTVSFKIIELSQNIAHKKGYLEILELVRYEKIGPTWFLVVNNQPLVPQVSTIIKEELSESIPEISLSPYCQELSKGKGSEGKPCGCPSNAEATGGTLDNTAEIKNNNNLQGERDKLSLVGGGQKT